DGRIPRDGDGLAPRSVRHDRRVRFRSIGPAHHFQPEAERAELARGAARCLNLLVRHAQLTEMAPLRAFALLVPLARWNSSRISTCAVSFAATGADGRSANSTIVIAGMSIDPTPPSPAGVDEPGV